jgi:hypothetical protein
MYRTSHVLPLYLLLLRLTFGHVCVPQAMAATACAPPAFKMCVTPAFLAQYSTSGVMLPSGRGGVASTTVLQPAICAGTASISALLGSTAVPPGTYTPAEMNVTVTRQGYSEVSNWYCALKLTQTLLLKVVTSCY